MLANLRKDFSDTIEETHPVREGTTINQWLDESGFRARLEEDPIVITVNQEEILEANYDRVLQNDDYLELILKPRGGEVLAVLTWIYYGLMVVAAIHILTMPEPKLPQNADQKEGSPTYSVNARGNRYRPETKGPILYGTLRVVPDFDQPPFSTYGRRNDQFLHMLFRVTQGMATVDLGSMTFEDTPFSNFGDDVQMEVLLPGEAPTLFPAGVVESQDMSNQELLDNYSIFYVANDVDTQINEISVDIVAPRGICKIVAEDHGLLNTEKRMYEVRVQIQAQEIDDNNNPVGDPFELGRPFLRNHNQNPLRSTYNYKVDPGRYQVRIRRLTPKDDSQYIVDTVNWTSLKGFLYGENEASICTRVAVKVRASERIGNSALTDISLIATRRLPTWSSSTGWGSAQDTNSIGWALADLCRASYAGNRSDLHYDLPRLAELDAQLTPAGHEFNAYFDTEGVTVWDALIMAGTPGRITPIDKAGFYTFVRDEPQTQAVQAFTMRNIIRGSFRVKHVGVLEETADSVLVRFRDEDNNYRSRELLCALPDSPAGNPRTVDLFGVTNATRAKELGMFLAASNRYRRRLTPFETGIEGRIPFYGKKIAISHFLLGVEGVPQISGDILGFDGTNKLRLSEKLTDHTFNDPHIVMIDLEGREMPAYPITIEDDYTVSVWDSPQAGSPDWTQVEFDPQYKKPMFMLGDGEEYVTYSKVTKVERDGPHVKIECFEDDPRVYFYGDDVVPPPHVTIPSPQTAAPRLSGLIASVGGTVANPEVYLSWSSQNADYVEIEISGDGGQTFEPVDEVRRGNSYVDLPDPGVYIYRLAAVNLFRGPWVAINVNTNSSQFDPPPNPTGLSLVSPFVGSELRVQWSSASVRHRVQVVIGSTVMYEETNVIGTQWRFSAETARANNIGRSFQVRVYAIGENTVMSGGFTSLNVSNPAPGALNSLVVASVYGGIRATFAWPNDPDVIGVSVWKGNSETFTPTDANRIITATPDREIDIALELDEEAWVRFAAVDSWGHEGLNISGTYEAKAYDPNLSQFQDAIDLINGPPSLSGSIAYQVAQEASQRQQDLEDLSTATGEAISDAVEYVENWVENDSAISVSMSQMLAQFGGDAANVLSYTIAQVDQSSQTAAIVDTLNTTVGENSSSIQLLTASLDGIESYFEVATNVNDLEGGFGFYNAGGVTRFAINANLMEVWAPGASSLGFSVVNGMVTMNMARITGTLDANNITVRNLTAETINGEISIIRAISTGVGMSFNAPWPTVVFTGELEESISEYGHKPGAVVNGVLRSTSFYYYQVQLQHVRTDSNFQTSHALGNPYGPAYNHILSASSTLVVFGPFPKTQFSDYGYNLAPGDRLRRDYETSPFQAQADVVDVNYREVGSEGNEDIEIEVYLENHTGRQFNSPGGSDILVNRRPWQTISELRIPGASGGMEVPFNLSGAAANRVAGSSSYIRVVIQPFESWTGNPAIGSNTGEFLRLTGMMMGTL